MADTRNRRCVRGDFDHHSFRIHSVFGERRPSVSISHSRPRSGDVLDGIYGNSGTSAAVGVDGSTTNLGKEWNQVLIQKASVGRLVVSATSTDT